MRWMTKQAFQATTCDLMTGNCGRSFQNVEELFSLQVAMMVSAIGEGERLQREREREREREAAQRY